MNNKKSILIVCFAMLVSFVLQDVNAQSEKKEKVRKKIAEQVENANKQAERDVKIYATISMLFDGMRTGDSTKVHQAFAPDPILQTVLVNKDKETKLHSEKLQGFLDAVGTPHDEVWNEKIITQNIQVDGNLAHVWTDYEFYVGEQYSHCGVNSFQLVKLNDEWKIVHLIDTRRKECETAEK